MRFKINKAEYDALPEALRAEYTENGEDFTLKIEDGPDFEKLERKRSIEAEHRKNAETKLYEAEKREQKLIDQLKNAGGDSEKIAEIEKKHQAEMQKLRDEREAEQKAAIEQRNLSMINDIASSFINEKFSAPPSIAKMVAASFASRLSIEDVDGQQVARVVDAEGKPSIMGVDELKKEFLDNADYSGIIKANAGKGGGASPSQQQRGGAEVKKFSEMTATEKAVMAKNDPTQYAAISQQS